MHALGRAWPCSMTVMRIRCFAFLCMCTAGWMGT